MSDPAHEERVSGSGPEYFAYQGLRPALDGIPLELTAVDQWVLWRAVPKPQGGMNKVPCQPSGRPASSTDPKTWADFGSCWSAFEESPEEFAGVGFVLTEQDDFIGGDLDHCCDAATGEMTPQAARIVEALGTYCEVSPSGTGIRFIGRGGLGRGFVGNGVEVYGSARFVTITGIRLGHTPEEIRPLDPRHIARLREIATGRRENGADSGPQGSDPVVFRLKEKGLYQRPLADGRHLITCPWVEEHSGGDASGTVFMEAHHGGHERAAFTCQHSHCGHRRLGDLLEHLGLGAGPRDPRPRFRSLRELQAGLRGADYLVKPLLERDSISLWFGDSDTYKSFIALGLGLSLAHGRSFYGFPTHGGPVFYVCGEGHGGIARRAAAWARDQGLEGDAPFYVSEVPAAFFDFENAAALGSEIAEIAGQHGVDPVLIIIDTLSANFGEGDESKNADVALFITNVNVCIRKRFGCAVIVIHHTGHQEKDRERGAYALRANTDCRVLFKRGPGAMETQVFSLKVKDGPKWEPLAFAGRVVDLVGVVDSEGEQATSLVFDRIEILTEPRAKDLPAKQAAVLDVLLDLYQAARKQGRRVGTSGPARVPAAAWRAECIRRGVVSDRRRFHELKGALSDAGLVRAEDSGCYPLGGEGYEDDLFD